MAMTHDRESGRSSAKNISRERATEAATRSPWKSRGVFDWRLVDAAAIRAALAVATDHSAALILGVTSDGGAASVTILDGDRRVKEYPNNAADASSYLQWVADTYFSQ